MQHPILDHTRPPRAVCRGWGLLLHTQLWTLMLHTATWPQANIARAGEKPSMEPGSWGHGASTLLCTSLPCTAGTAWRPSHHHGTAGSLLFPLSLNEVQTRYALFFMEKITLSNGKLAQTELPPVQQLCSSTLRAFTYKLWPPSD